MANQPAWHLEARRVTTLLAVLLAASLCALLAVGVLNFRVAASPAGLPDCTVDDLPALHPDYDEWATTLLDPAHTLGSTYAPPDLRSATVNGQQVTLRAFVLDPLSALLTAAAADGVTIRVNSSYRSYSDQRDLVRANPGMTDLIARPGHSEHQLGTAVDLSGGDEWLAGNAARFGFVLSFPPARSPEWTCFRGEPWHFRFVGQAEAEAIERSGLSPREWLWVTVGAG